MIETRISPVTSISKLIIVLRLSLEEALRKGPRRIVISSAMMLNCIVNVDVKCTVRVKACSVGYVIESLILIYESVPVN